MEEKWPLGPRRRAVLKGTGSPCLCFPDSPPFFQTSGSFCGHCVTPKGCSPGCSGWAGLPLWFLRLHPVYLCLFSSACALLPRFLSLFWSLLFLRPLGASAALDLSHLCLCSWREKKKEKKHQKKKKQKQKQMEWMHVWVAPHLSFNVTNRI